MKAPSMSLTYKSDVGCFRFPSVTEFDIAEFRQSTGLSQAQFAADHGISLSTLKKWEQHKAEPKVGSVAFIIDAWFAERLKSFAV